MALAKDMIFYLNMTDKDKSLSALHFYAEAGVDEIIGYEPLNRMNKNLATALTQMANIQSHSAGLVSPNQSIIRTISEAEKSAKSLASGAGDLETLCEAMKHFDTCSLKKTASNTVFGVGNTGARIMLVGEAPGAEEDRQGLPFVGISGQLLDQMLDSISLKRSSVYITNMLAWRPPGNRKPTSEEISMCLPFIQRQIELVAPKVLVFVGGTAATNLLDNPAGITRIRGRWFDYRIQDSEPLNEIPAMPIFHPAYLLRQPALKRMAWIDLQAIKARLEDID